MKKPLWIITAVLFSLPVIAHASCDSVKADIEQKIIHNGVPASGFTLTIVPNDEVDSAGGQVVGHCENDSQKIVYKRITSETQTLPSDAGTSEDSPSP